MAARNAARFLSRALALIPLESVFRGGGRAVTGSGRQDRSAGCYSRAAVSAQPVGRPTLVIYTDGGARPNPGPGGWAAVILEPGGKPRELSGGAPSTTNNRMELQAAISALADLSEPRTVDLYTDSQYVRQGITSWLAGWRGRGWRRRDGGAVRNVDLWRRLEALSRRHRIRWHWVRGHAGNEWNERVDALASAEIAALGGGVAAAAEPDLELPPGSARIYLKVRCVGGRGAWAAELETPDGSFRRTGTVSGTTPNRLELACVLDLLAALPEGQPVAVYTGSDYLRRGASVWLRSWKRKRWRTKAGGQVRNADLWRRLDRQLAARRVFWPAPVGDAVERLAELKEGLRELF